MMLERIQKLSLKDKKTLLAMLQSDLNLTIDVEIVAEKPSFYQLETRKCNEIAKVKRSGGNVIYTDLQIVD